jgi:hypothetical protein
MVRISSITLDALLELVGGQVIDELGEDSLSGIHPSLSKIRAASDHPALAPGSAAIQFKSKNESHTLSLVICDFYRGRPDFSRTLLILRAGHARIACARVNGEVSHHRQEPTEIAA